MYLSDFYHFFFSFFLVFQYPLPCSYGLAMVDLFVKSKILITIIRFLEDFLRGRGEEGEYVQEGNPHKKDWGVVPFRVKKVVLIPLRVFSLKVYTSFYGTL